MPLSKNIDDFSIAAKHTEFRRVDKSKITAEVLDQYKYVVRSKVNLFYCTNTKLCQLLGYDQDDLKQIAWCWAVNYHGLYSKNDRLQDIKIFNNYMRQRLYRLKQILERTYRNSSQYTPDEMLVRPQSSESELNEKLGSLDPNEAISALKKAKRKATKTNDVRLLSLIKKKLETYTPAIKGSNGKRRSRKA